MDQSGTPTPTQRRIAAVALLIGGVIPALGYFDLGPVGRDDIQGPPWLGLAAGGIFIAAAGALLVGQRWPRAGELLGLLILVGFAAIGNWIAFGAGERVCGVSLSLGGLWGEGDVDGLACRVPFGIGALIVDGAIVWVAVTLLQKALGGPPALARTRSAAGTLLLLCLAPLLIPLLLVLVVPALGGAAYTRVTTGRWPRNEAFARRRARRPGGGDPDDAKT